MDTLTKYTRGLVILGSIAIASSCILDDHQVIKTIIMTSTMIIFTSWFCWSLTQDTKKACHKFQPGDVVSLDRKQWTIKQKISGWETPPQPWYVLESSEEMIERNESALLAQETWYMRHKRHTRSIRKK